MRTLLLVLAMAPSLAMAGRGSSNTALRDAVASGSVDAIVSELERAEKLACVSCLDTVTPLLDHPEARVRDAAAWWLARRGTAPGLRDTAIARLQGADPGLARNGADALARLGAGEGAAATVAALSTYLASPLDGDSAVAAANALGKIGDPAGLPALTAASLSGASAPARAAALKAIRDLRSPSAATVAALVPALSDGDEAVREQAVYTLGALGAATRDRSCVAAMMGVVAKDGSAAVRKHAAWALGQLGDRAAVPALSQAMSDPDPGVRSIARGALTRLK